MLEMRIQRRKACPDRCPECGKSHLFPKDDSIGELLKYVYSSPSKVVKRPVPGWPGFYQWWFICHHESPLSISLATGHNPFTSMVRRLGDYCGGTYILPLSSK